jgi:DNA-binding CsgD family transcriptional regulator
MTMDFDPIAAVETLYRTDLPSEEWLGATMAAVRPLIDPQHQGVYGGLYRCPDPTSFAPEHPLLFLGLSDRLRAIFDHGMQGLTEEFVAGTFLCHGIVRGTGVEGWDRIPPVRDGAFHAEGLADILNVVVVEPDGAGCAVSNFRTKPATLGGPDGHLLRGIFRHFAAAHRLHRKLRGPAISPDLADAVLDSNGRLQHARGAAADPASRRALRRAVLRSEEARGRRRRRDPHRALDAWEHLVEGRWSFVDHFDHDGRRFLLAVENARPASGFHLLSARECDVVERALGGADNKVIAYDLGIAHSTVKVLIARAAFKLGVRTRRQLLDKLRLRSASVRGAR